MSLNSLPPVQEVAVPLGERTYSVFVGKGAVSHIHRLLPASAKRAVVVTQSGIAAIPDLEIPTLTIHIPAGEEHKSLSTIEDLCRQFAQFGLTRNDVVIGVGGGLVFFYRRHICHHNHVIGFANAFVVQPNHLPRGKGLRYRRDDVVACRAAEAIGK